VAAQLRNNPRPPRDGFFSQFVGVLNDAARLVEHYNSTLPKSAYDVEVVEPQKALAEN
jgi:hypothetical protein